MGSLHVNYNVDVSLTLKLKLDCMHSKPDSQSGTMLPNTSGRPAAWWPEAGHIASLTSGLVCIGGIPKLVTHVGLFVSALKFCNLDFK